MLKDELGLEDGYLKVYPTNGYGNPELLRDIIKLEKPDYSSLYRPKILGMVISHGT